MLTEFKKLKTSASLQSVRPSPPVHMPSLVRLSLAHGKMLFLQGPPEMQPLPQGALCLSMGSAPTTPPQESFVLSPAFIHPP